MTTTPATTSDKPMTMRDFARAIGVSKTTVSKAFTGNGRIAPATRETILRAAETMGFDLNPHAQRLSTGKSLDLITLFHPGIESGAVPNKSFRIQQFLEARGLDAPLYSSGVEDQVIALRRLRRQRPRAIVCATLSLTEPALAELKDYQEEGGSVIAFDAPIALEADAVLFDREDNAYQVVRHLLEQGHRKIGLYLVGGPSNPHRWVVPRLDGYRRALAEFGLVERTDWHFGGNDSEDDGGVLAARFLQLNDRPTALYIGNERVASSFLNNVLRAGLRVPQDISVVSNDDQPVARHAIVPLTTVSYPVEAIAQQVADFVQRRLEEPLAAPRQAILRGSLVIRESVASL